MARDACSHYRAPRRHPRTLRPPLVAEAGSLHRLLSLRRGNFPLDGETRPQFREEFDRFLASAGAPNAVLMLLFLACPEDVFLDERACPGPQSGATRRNARRGSP